MNALEILENLKAQFPQLFDNSDIEVDCADVVMVLGESLQQWDGK